MTTPFTGFTPDSLQFLQEVRQRNSKEWYDEHKPLYQQALVEPFQALVDALSPVMLHIDDLFETRPAIGKTLSRIHRDTRFSHDKTRYRSNMWFTFKRYHKDWTDAPTYFFELFPDGWRFGLGYYSASKTTMDLFRQTLRDNPKGFLKIANNLGSTFALEGDSYKRPLIKDQPEELATWYNRKSLAAIATRPDVETVFSEGLVNILAQGFSQLAPLYHYLMKIEVMKRDAEAELAGTSGLDKKWLG